MLSRKAVICAGDKSAVSSDNSLFLRHPIKSGQIKTARASDHARVCILTHRLSSTQLLQRQPADAEHLYSNHYLGRHSRNIKQ